MTKEIVFIHDMFMTPKSWANWVEYFSGLGYVCHAPAWPLHDADPATLRAAIPEGTGDIMLADVIETIDRAIDACAEPPILIGHSIGGLVVQVLVNRGRAAAGVSISPVAPNAMLSMEWHFLKSTVPILNPIAGDAPQEMTPEHFHETFANVMAEAEAVTAYDLHAVHESRNVLRSALGSAGHVDFEKPHVPLLFVTGEEDNIVPDSLVERNYEAYPVNAGEKAIRIFEAHGHYICNEPGWHEVATYIAEWLRSDTTAGLPGAVISSVPR